jgi:hypothetical protein
MGAGDTSLVGQAQALAQQLHRVAERHARLFHHPVNRPATHAAAEAVPQVF